ncbi:MAG: gamma-mobile-trio protein GmtX [Pseudomonas fluorescens]
MTAKHQATILPDILKNARQLYQASRAAATKSSKLENLDKVWEVLEAIRLEGSRDYSLAEVGRRLERINGPRTQSLRNTQGSDYRNIISAYADAVSGSTRYVAKTKSNLEQALALITDPSIRATIRIALDEAKRLKVVNDNLHAAFKALKIGTTLTPPPPTDGVPPLATLIQESNNLSLRFVKALRKGIDSTRLAQQGLHVGGEGSVENEHGDKIFPPAFVFAIQAVLDRNE